jgi:hypothetical protein
MTQYPYRTSEESQDTIQQALNAHTKTERASILTNAGLAATEVWIHMLREGTLIYLKYSRMSSGTLEVIPTQWRLMISSIHLV